MRAAIWCFVMLSPGLVWSGFAVLMDRTRLGWMRRKLEGTNKFTVTAGDWGIASCPARKNSGSGEARVWRLTSKCSSCSKTPRCSIATQDSTGLNT